MDQLTIDFSSVGVWLNAAYPGAVEVGNLLIVLVEWGVGMSWVMASED